MTELMKQYEDEQDRIPVVEHSTGKVYLPKYGEWLERKVLNLMDKAETYDRLMSGGKFTMKEMANIKKRPVTIDKDGTINAHGAIPHLGRGVFAGFTDCWANDADDYEEIPESFVEIPDGFDWATSLTLPDGWEEAQENAYKGSPLRSSHKPIDGVVDTPKDAVQPVFHIGDKIRFKSTGEIEKISTISHGGRFINGVNSNDVELIKEAK